jgi:hypothetical protein
MATALFNQVYVDLHDICCQPTAATVIVYLM